MPDVPPPAPGDRQADAADRALLVAAAEDAGTVALAHFRKAPRSWEKGGGQGPVSDADLAVNARLKSDLLAARPGYGWLSEEDPDGPARLDAGRIFVVDPIDGTRAFLEGKRGFAVAAAVIEGNRVVAGAVHLPAREETYAAHLGGGATLGAERLAASRRRAVDGARAVGARSMFRADHWMGEAPRGLDVEWRSSLAWRLCLVASGRYDLMVTFRDAWEWDVAAASLIAAEAGAVVTDGAGEPIVWNGPTARVPGVIAAAPGLFAELLARRTGR